jgi:hypothetical protein
VWGGVGMNKLFAVFVVLAVALPLRAQTAGTKPVFLVTDVVVADDVPIEKDTARDVLATRFGRLKDKLEVRSMAEVRASVDNAAFQQLLGSENEADLSKIEDYIKVDRLVLGRIAMVAGVVDVQVKVFNVREGVVEVGFARRLGKGADRTLILTLLDSLADSLLAWTIDTYTDGSMSAEAQKLAGKKLTKRSAEPAVASSSPWSALGAVGGGVMGAGLVATGLGAYNTFGTTDGASTTNIATFAGGAAAVVVGGVLVGIDVATE